MKNALTALAIVALTVACANNDQAAAPKQTSSAAAAPAAHSGQLTGKVVETMNGGGYTYLLVSTPSGDQWAAVPQTTVAVGDQIALTVQMTMDEFESKTLNRKFDRIVFATMAGGSGAPMQAQAQPETPTQHMQAPDAGPIAVEKAPGGRSVAEVWAQKGSLQGKEVVVRARVVKFLGGIMATNWMHLQDGTGSRAKGDNDLTVTTEGSAKVGDIVTVRGIVAVDKDFGSGYQYPVIIEKATITK